MEATSQMSFLSDIRPHSILDPIHGLIRLTEAEFAVMDHPLFRRLRRIKQNGLLYLVFPSATHTRFEHSLGALHVADAMLEGVRLNSIVSRRKGTIAAFSEAIEDVAVDFSELDDGSYPWIVSLTRMAALVHDLGHGPLSHTFDSFAVYRKDLRAILESGAIPALASIAELVSEWGKEGIAGSPASDRVPHEVMSCVFFAYAWEEILKSDYCKPLRSQAFSPGLDTTDLPLWVTAVLLGDTKLVGTTLEPSKSQWLPFIHDIVASAPADADRMDYLERDSRAVGVTYGLFDRNRVLKSLLCFRSTRTGSTLYRLGIKRSGVPALENVVQARFELYVQVYYHKTNAAINLMLKELGLAAQEQENLLFQFDRNRPREALKIIIDRYLDLDDDQFLRLLRGGVQTVEVPEEIRRLASAVHERRLWKRIYEGSEAVAHMVADFLRQSEPDQGVRAGIAEDVSKPKATKDLDRGAVLLIRGPDDLYRPVPELSWYQVSVVISALHEAGGNIGRVYARDAALAEPHFSRLRSSARTQGIVLEADQVEKEKRAKG